jgi:hypothetical protein
MSFFNLDQQPKCVKRAYGGFILGSIMGTFAGTATLMFSHPAGIRHVLKLLKGDVYFRQNALVEFGKSLGFLSSWTCLYQTVRCIGHENKAEEPLTTITALAISVAPFLRTRLFQRHLPWVLGSVALDVYHTSS